MGLRGECRILSVPPVNNKNIIVMYIYHALINALSAHMMHVNLNMMFCTHVEHSPTRHSTTWWSERKLVGKEGGAKSSNVKPSVYFSVSIIHRCHCAYDCMLMFLVVGSASIQDFRQYCKWSVWHTAFKCFQKCPALGTFSQPYNSLAISREAVASLVQTASFFSGVCVCVCVAN